MITSLGTNTEKIRLTEKETWGITRKLCRHFKFPEPKEIRFFGGDNSRGIAELLKYSIRVPHNTSLKLLLHELGHLYVYHKKYSESSLSELFDNSNEKYHTKKLMRILKRFTKYCMKKKFWEKIDDETTIDFS
jgi:hypothetical protein